MTVVHLATEDPLSEVVADRLVREAIPDVHIPPPLGRKGSGYLKANIAKFMEMARTYPVVLLTDLDTVACPPTLIGSWCKGRSVPDGLLFRVAVREVEAWLMADRAGFAAVTGIPRLKVPQDVEGLDDPKETLLGLVRRYARKDVRADLLPTDPRRTARVGPGYNARLAAFVRDANGWDPARAAENAGSLKRARTRLAALA
ncbi:hypothetical protein [Roseospira visakhapatnamensis]|uniref:DUF4276 family protein n=1 Tax=Roseospira visakhapatnamensis TaxID=390880 RepID=A0A7W6R9W7_9PROT|nr:hypothetical protein [Roseospira visakhapatnamensis]MBB4264640.1 hypothetical protein [Roseospira visakhapatnamensis]